MPLVLLEGGGWQEGRHLVLTHTYVCAKGLSEQRGARWSEPRWRLDVRCLCAEWWKCVKGTKRGCVLLFLSVKAAKDAFCTKKCPPLCSEGRVEAEHGFCSSLLEEILVSAGAAPSQGRRCCRGVWGGLDHGSDGLHRLSSMDNLPTYLPAYPKSGASRRPTSE